VFIIIWEFAIRPGQRAAFETAYGPEGEWAALFRGCPGFERCELLQDAEDPDRYVTLDYWQMPEAHVLGMQRIAGAYQELDARCDALTIRERRVGNFTLP
jgi:heme-degrading monooxygenase HmoA